MLPLQQGSPRQLEHRPPDQHQSSQLTAKQSNTNHKPDTPSYSATFGPSPVTYGHVTSNSSSPVSADHQAFISASVGHQDTSGYGDTRCVSVGGPLVAHGHDNSQSTYSSIQNQDGLHRNYQSNIVNNFQRDSLSFNSFPQAELQFKPIGNVNNYATPTTDQMSYSYENSPINSSTNSCKQFQRSISQNSSCSSASSYQGNIPVTNLRECLVPPSSCQLDERHHQESTLGGPTKAMYTQDTAAAYDAG